jgi:hypothetical protein
MNEPPTRELHAVRLPDKFAPCSPLAGHPPLAGRPVPAACSGEAGTETKNWQAVCPDKSGPAQTAQTGPEVR